LGFGAVEVGTITPRPQPGSPRPRVFRLPEDGAVINRLGFNSRGLDAARARLAARKGGHGGLVGANIGMNRDAPDPVADYVRVLRGVHPLVDYVAVNVSSPNTPGLRGLQAGDRLRELLGALLAARAELGPAGKPLLVKIAPDLRPDEEAAIAETALALGIEGLIVSNTTVARPASLIGRHRAEAGGLSGRPLFGPSTELLRRMYRLTGGRLALVGVGGVASGADAYAKLRAGAGLVQLYTAMVYEGPGILGRLCAELDALLERDGFAGVREAVGADARGASAA
ncbi:MAG TPA: quinone-dependent dihydroorotate dehydrogenase, partial [Geminicoccaceae bacterium]|nr:quinone-dependent dihydroorotate dehydrogenase [Geminicoccaceae bacterium]